MSAEAGLSNGFISDVLVAEMVASQQARIAELTTPPHLAILLSGRPGSHPAYAANRSYALRLEAHGELIGASTDIHIIEEPTSANTLRLIQSLNEAPEVDGIIPMLPAPSSELNNLMRSSVKPDKDIDGVTSNSLFYPATPVAMVHTAEVMLQKQLDSATDVGGIAVIGNGAVVGQPLAELLRGRGVRDLTVLGTKPEIEAGVPELHSFARVIFSAIPVAKVIRAQHLAPGSTIVDVGYGIDAETQRPCGNVDPLVFNDSRFSATAFRQSVGPVTAAIIQERVLERAYLKHLGVAA
jgi:methylenetetrahydrofolate dehydrogenase (NADP+)/methenyltetrahydrofolate cyclohydrolase